MSPPAVMDKQTASAVAVAIYNLHEGLTCDLPQTPSGWAARQRFEMALDALVGIANLEKVPEKG